MVNICIRYQGVVFAVCCDLIWAASRIQFFILPRGALMVLIGMILG